MWNKICHGIAAAWYFILNVIRRCGQFSFWTATIVFSGMILILAVFYAWDPNMTKYCLKTTTDKEIETMSSVLVWTLIFWAVGGMIMIIL